MNKSKTKKTEVNVKATFYKRITLFLCLVLLLALAAVGAIFGAGSTQASAATYTTPKYKTYGTTTEGTTTTSGSPGNFTIYMHGSSTSGTGTMYNDRLIDWSYVYIKIEVSAMSAHESFKIYLFQQNPVGQLEHDALFGQSFFGRIRADLYRQL